VVVVTGRGLREGGQGGSQQEEGDEVSHSGPVDRL
jgi:hypothetical protein